MANKENRQLDADHIAEAVCAADRALVAAEASRDLEAALDCMAPDIVLQPPDMPMVVGRAAVRRFYTAWFALPYTSIQVHSQTVTVASSGDFACLVGESSFVLGAPPEERRVPGKYLGVWKKVDDAWKLAAISWSGNAASGAR